MKRYNNLLPKILDSENLYLAYWKARRSKEGKQDVKSYADNLEANLNKLCENLLSAQFENEHYNKFTIHDPKERIICAAPFEMRVMHHALMNICGPLLDKRLIDDCFASRKNKGTYVALERARYYHKKYDYCVKMDIRKYFDSINHLILKRQLFRIFKEEKLLLVFYNIVDGYCTNKGVGLPIGNLTSQYFANQYLCEFDHYAKEQLPVKGYVRYMDDILIYGNDKDELMSKAKELRSFLQKKLMLTLKVMDLRKTSQTTQFLGYRLTKNKLLLSQRSKKRYKMKLKSYFDNYNHGIWQQDEMYRHLSPLINFVSKAESATIRKNALLKAT